MTAVATDERQDLDVNLNNEVPCDGYFPLSGAVPCPDEAPAIWRAVIRCCGVRSKHRCDFCKKATESFDIFVCRHCFSPRSLTWERLRPQQPQKGSRSRTAPVERRDPSGRPLRPTRPLLPPLRNPWDHLRLPRHTSKHSQPFTTNPRTGRLPP